MATVSVRYIVDDVDAAIAFLPGGTRPEPGGWNRIWLEVTGLEELADSLRGAGGHFRNEIVTGAGGRQILLDDPAGNPVELFGLYR